MSISTLLGQSLDRDMYRPGHVTTMTSAVRRYRDRPALKVGEAVTIQRMTHVSDGYGGFTARVLVATASGAERWINGTDVEPVPADSVPAHPALTRVVEIIAERA